MSAGWSLVVALVICVAIVAVVFAAAGMPDNGWDDPNG